MLSSHKVIRNKRAVGCKTNYSLWLIGKLCMRSLARQVLLVKILMGFHASTILSVWKWFRIFFIISGMFLAVHLHWWDNWRLIDSIVRLCCARSLASVYSPVGILMLYCIIGSGNAASLIGFGIRKTYNKIIHKTNTSIQNEYLVSTSRF